MIAAGVEAQALLIFDLHDDGLVRADIGDAVGEDVRPLLLDEARSFPFGLGGLVDLARLPAFLDLAFDQALSDLHLERVDRGAVGQRKEIDALDPAVGGILEALGDARARHRSRNVDREVGGDAGRREIAARHRRLEQKLARAGVVAAHQAFAAAWFGVCARVWMEKPAIRPLKARIANRTLKI